MATPESDRPSVDPSEPSGTDVPTQASVLVLAFALAFTLSFAQEKVKELFQQNQTLV